MCTPNYPRLQEIGCRAFVLVQNKHYPKIYERSLECILIGYEQNSLAYHCYHKKIHKVVFSYHVHFLETYDGHPSSPDQSDVVPDVQGPGEPETRSITEVRDTA